MQRSAQLSAARWTYPERGTSPRERDGHVRSRGPQFDYRKKAYLRSSLAPPNLAFLVAQLSSTRSVE
jgi:hypothetical protein